jgi:hypothetical protein
MEDKNINKRFGKLKVLEISRKERKASNGTRKFLYSKFYMCICDCGNKKEIRSNDLVANKVNSCGCIKQISARNNTFKDIKGKRFGKATVISFYDSKNNRARWVCQCDCNNIFISSGKDLRDGNTKSCGCIKSESTKFLWDTLWKDKRSSKDTRSSSSYRNWVKFIKNLYHSVCVVCGSTSILHVHHLESYKKNKEMRTYLNNGVLLCRSCHINFHSFAKKNVTRGNFRNYLE